MKPTNTLCGKNAELLFVKVGGTYSYHLDFKTIELSLSAWGD
jgi:hypothetical protein